MDERYLDGRLEIFRASTMSSSMVEAKMLAGEGNQLIQVYLEMAISTCMLCVRVMITE